jgi:anti-sigma B factor antagonist
MELLKTEFIEGDPAVLQVDGEIDLSTADQLRTALQEALATNPKVVVDMAGVTFCDASGLRVVLQVAASRDGAGPLKLLNAPRVARILELLGLSESTSIMIRDGSDEHGR